MKDAMSQNNQGCSYSKLSAFLYILSIFLLLELVVFFSSKDLTKSRSEPVRMIEKRRPNWIIFNQYFCNEIESAITKDWVLNVRIEDKIYNCENDKMYLNDLDFLENVISAGGEKIALFKSLPKDLHKWTDSFTLIIPNKTSHEAEVCWKTQHSLTVETSDFPMNDWDTPFHVGNRPIKISLLADMIFNRDSFWLFPLLNNTSVFRKGLGLLNSHTIIRSIDNNDLLQSRHIPPSQTVSCKQKTILQCLETFEKSDLLSQTIEMLDRVQYQWPTSLPTDKKMRNCYGVIWKEEGRKQTTNPDCHEIALRAPLQGQKPMRYDILLVIVYNHPLYKNIPYVNSLYENLFKYIAYCGPNEMPENFNQYFVQYENVKGHITGGFGQACSSIYLSLRHKHTRGLLIISDDMLLNVHRLPQISLSHVWVKGSYKRDIRKIDNESTWVQWKKYKNPIIQALTNLYSSKEVHLRKCGERLEKIGGNRYTISGGYSDIYYIPYSLAQEFININNHFLDYKIPFEISVPTVILCMSKKKPLVNLDIRALHRNKQWETIDKFYQVTYIHPVKWGLMRREKPDYKQWQSLFCRSKAFINDISGNKQLLQI